MSGSPSLRGCGDTLTRRLDELRADILARGLPTWHLHACGFPPVSTRKAENVPRWFQFFRSRGVSVVHVYETRSLGHYRVWVDKGADWLLLSNPIVLPSLPRCERSESAERSKRHAK